MWNDRVARHLEEGSLGDEDLVELIRITEGYGKQHVLFFQMHDAESHEPLTVDLPELGTTIEELGLDPLLQSELIVTPDGLHLSDIELAPQGVSFKFVERRERYETVAEEEHGEELIIRRQRVVTRAVNAVDVLPNGDVIARIESHDRKADYPSFAATLWHQLSDIFPNSYLRPCSLRKAVQKLTKNRTEALKRDTRLRTAAFKNSAGFSWTGASPSPDEDLYGDKNSDKAVEAINSGTEAAGLIFLAKEKSLPEKDVRVLFPPPHSVMNEFVVTGSCTKRDFEHVFRYIVRLA